MREIKFRGKTGSFWQTTQAVDDEWELFWNTVDMETVGEYTGHKDKNGVEIYEGDFLACWVGFGQNRERVYGEVYWIKEEAKFDLASPLDRFEVIGNIYENPELVK